MIDGALEAFATIKASALSPLAATTTDDAMGAARAACGGAFGAARAAFGAVSAHAREPRQQQRFLYENDALLRH